MAQKSANPREVRAWARDNGFKVGIKGRLAPEVVEAYNKAHRVKYRPGEFVNTIEVRGRIVTSKGGTTPVRRRAISSDVRTAAAEAGVQLGERGRLSAAVKAAYASGQLAEFARLQKLIG